MLPTVWGQLHSQVILNITTNKEFIRNTLSLEFGEMEFVLLTVGDCVFPNEKNTVHELNSTHPARWSCPHQ